MGISAVGRLLTLSGDSLDVLRHHQVDVLVEAHLGARAGRVLQQVGYEAHALRGRVGEAGRHIDPELGGAGRRVAEHALRAPRKWGQLLSGEAAEI